MRWSFALGVGLALAWAPTPATAESVVVDRTLVRFTAPELGGARRPSFVFERELAFEARLEALGDPDHTGVEPFRDRHVTSALERHIAETLLSRLHIDPEPSAVQIAAQARAARAMLVERVGGVERLEAAARAEQISELEVQTLLRRRARASLYLDRMVAPMLRPTQSELRTLHASRQTPFSTAPYEDVEPRLRRWYAGQRLASAVSAYYQGARARLKVHFLHAPPAGSR